MKLASRFPSMALVVLSASLLTAQAPLRGVDTSRMDVTVKPGDNFYRYANGAWLDRSEIPADRTSFSGFSLLADVVNQRVATIIRDAAKASAAPRTEQRKIADLYASYMDEAAIETRGLSPIKPQLDAIAAIKTRTELAAALGHTLRADVDALNNTNFRTANLFGLWVAPGFNDPDHYTAYLMQGGLTMPSRDYYISGSPRFVAIRDKYKAHIAAMFTLAGYNHPEQRAESVFHLESSIALKHLSLAENLDIKKANNPWKKSDFEKNAPGLDWNVYFEAAGLARQPEFIVWQPAAFAGESALVASLSMDAWQNFLIFHLLEDYGASLPKAFAEERFDFTGKTLTGAQVQRPRDQRALVSVNATLGDAVGKVYAARYFPAADKARVEEMVHNLLVAFRTRLEALPWMAPATKAEALRKLSTLQVGIGYAGKWRSYDALEIKSDDLLGNLWRASLFKYHGALAQIGKATDRKEWCMTPQTVNAVNLPLDNGLNFPAALFGPPFFDDKATDAVNYGAVGTIIGHEISHTFDSEGAAFDSQGKVRNWWTDEDRAHFDASIESLAKQYDTYTPFADLHLNGHQTLGENIADLAGITASYDAWKASLHGKAAPTAPGPNGTTLSGDEQFFLGFAQSEGGKSRESALRQQVLTDVHSPGEYRADTVRNLDPWYAAFDVKPDQTLYLAPAQRVHIW